MWRWILAVLVALGLQVEVQHLQAEQERREREFVEVTEKIANVIKAHQEFINEQLKLNRQLVDVVRGVK